ncbi:MAG: threonine--tRNA ligase [Acidobacteriota bacterium]
MKEISLKNSAVQKGEMIRVTFPDGTVKNYPRGVKLSDIITQSGSKKYENAIAARVNESLKDLSASLEEDSRLDFILPPSDEALEIYRHTTSHILANAVKSLFPNVKIGIGPAIADGFYYDFDKSEPFTPEDLVKIEEKMREIIRQDLPMVRKVAPKHDVLNIFRSMNEDLKLELIEEKGGECCSYYEQGDFVDFCLGPHLPSTGKVKAFKLLSVAGAYWKGDEKNKMLQRIYGTAFFSEEELKSYLNLLEEARRRDHRKLGKELGIFSIHEEAGAGLIYWHPKGAIIRRIIEEFWKDEHIKRGYQLVSTPHIANSRIWRESGHYDYYLENMYRFNIDDDEHVIKPMNCPGHILIYKSGKHSYRELPVRFAELGTVYRYERSGVLHGMMRVRGFTQDDAHIFCTNEQLESEIEGVIDLAKHMLSSFGYSEYQIDLSTSDPSNPQKYAGMRAEWHDAEKILEKVLKRKRIEYSVMKGEAAFYGPKIDIKMLDALKRAWQGPTIQLDFNLPSRLGVYYTAADSKEYPVLMVHRTVLGSIERFVGGLLEHYAGAFPAWLAPIQIRILTITDRTRSYAMKLKETLASNGFRVEADLRNEKIGLKIREAQLEKIPFMAVVGDREEKDGNISLRIRGKGDKGMYSLDAFIQYAKRIVDEKDLKQ